MTRSTEQKTVEVGDGVFAYLQLDGGWCLNNAGIIRGSTRTVVVDTAATVSRARALRDAVDLISGPVPTTLVNTHHHGDHCFGNSLFDDSSLVIAHDRTRRELEDGGLALCGLWPEVDWGDVRLRLPDVTFGDELTLHIGDREARLVHVGPAHTTNDIVVLLPAEKVLFVGDVVSNGVTPFVLMGSVAGSLAAIERLRTMDITTIVPGHGPVGGVELLDQTVGYLRWIQRVAAEGRAASQTPLEAARSADLGEYAGLVDAERIVGNLVRAYAELDGEPHGAPLDVLSAFKEMIEFHGGAPACLA